MALLLEAQEQAGLKNREYPDLYYPFFNGYDGPTPEPTYFDLTLSSSIIIKNIEVDFNYHESDNVAYDTIFGINSTHRLEVNIQPNGDVELFVFDGTTRTVTIPAGRWKVGEYVKLRVNFSPLVITVFDISTKELLLVPEDLGSLTTTWLPNWTYGETLTVGALISGSNYIRGNIGFIGKIKIEYFNLSFDEYDMADENRAGNLENVGTTFNPASNYPATRLKKYLLDTIEDTAINVVKQSGDVREPGKIKSDYTQSFDLPFSNINNHFFAHVYDVNVTGTFFNTYKKAYVVLKNTTGNLVISGIMLLNKVDQVNKVYNITIYGENSTFWEAMQGKTLSDLSVEFWSNYDHVGTRANIEASWTNTAVNVDGNAIPDLFYPIESYGKTVNNVIWSANLLGNTMTYQGFRPSLRVKTLLDQVIKEAGLKYESEFLNSTDFTDLYLTLANKKSMGLSTKTFYPIEATNVGTPQNIVNTGSSNHRAVFNFATSEIDPDGAFDASTGLYIPLFTSIVDIEYSFTIRVNNYTDEGTLTAFIRPTDSSGNSQDNTSLFQYLAGYNFSDNPLANSSAFPGGGSGFSLSNQGGGVHLGTSSGLMRVNCNSLTPFAITISVNGLPRSGTDYVNVELTIKTVKAVDIQKPSEIRRIEQYNLDFPQKDLITSLAKMFNLVFEPINSTTLKIEPFETYVNQGLEIDWTEKLNGGGLIENNIDSRKEQIKFSYADTPDALINRVEQERMYPTNGWIFEPTNTDWLNQKEEIKASLIAPFWHQAASSFFIPMRYNSVGPIDDVPQIGYKVSYGYGTPTLPFYITSIEPPQSSVPNLTVHTLSPYKSFPLTADTKTLEFGLYKNAVNHVVGSQSSYLFPTVAENTLHKVYWDKWFNEIYNDKARIFRGKFALSPSDVDVALNSKIFIKDAFYRIQTIKYNANSNDLAEIELVKLIDFDFNDYSAWNCDLKVQTTGGPGQTFIFEDVQGNESNGTKNCCDAVGGIWYSDPATDNGIFYCYNGGIING